MIHPETGEVLETRQEFQTALREIEEELAPLYRLRREIREVADVKFSPPDMPSPRWRTPTQDRVTRCPRCGSRESENRAANILAINFHSESGQTLGGRDPIEILHDLAKVLYAENEEAPNA